MDERRQQITRCGSEIFLSAIFRPSKRLRHFYDDRNIVDRKMWFWNISVSNISAVETNAAFL